MILVACIVFFQLCGKGPKRPNICNTVATSSVSNGIMEKIFLYFDLGKVLIMS